MLQSGFAFDEPFTITLRYRDGDIAGLSESTLALLYWDGSAWSSDGIVLVWRNLSGNQVAFTVDHLSDFALVAEESYTVYVPLVLK